MKQLKSRNDGDSGSSDGGVAKQHDDERQGDTNPLHRLVLVILIMYFYNKIKY